MKPWANPILGQGSNSCGVPVRRCSQCVVQERTDGRLGILRRARIVAQMMAEVDARRRVDIEGVRRARIDDQRYPSGGDRLAASSPSP